MINPNEITLDIDKDLFDINNRGFSDYIKYVKSNPTLLKFLHEYTDAIILNHKVNIKKYYITEEYIYELNNDIKVKVEYDGVAKIVLDDLHLKDITWYGINFVLVN